MSESENILGRIREALTRVAPKPGKHGANHVGCSSAQAREWLPPVGDSSEARLALFAKNCSDLKATFLLFPDAFGFNESLAGLKSSLGWKSVAIHSQPVVEEVCQLLDLPTLRVDGGYDVQELEKCDVGITACDALVAQTGSVLLTSRSAGGRALSVLPPHHLVVARRNQIVADLPEAFALLKQRYGDKYPSFISFVTGPSRTGDIERILVLGAHGPRKLTILCY